MSWITRFWNSRLKPVLLPVGVAALGFILFFILLATGPKLDSQPPVAIKPLVQSQVIEISTLQLTAGAFGTVEPRSETDLVAEVSGRIVSMAQGMVTGGFFDAGEVLIEVDPSDYKIALELASAVLRLIIQTLVKSLLRMLLIRRYLIYFKGC